MNNQHNNEITCNHKFSEFHEIKCPTETIVLHGKTVTLDHFYQRECIHCGQIQVETDMKRVTLSNERLEGKSRSLTQNK